MLAGSALSLWGQSAFDGPASGYVFDNSARSVRAVAGVPGAALLGPASGPAWDFLSVAPNGKRALAIGNGSINLIPDLSRPANYAVLAPAQADVIRIVWSADSTAAATWSPRAREMRRISGLDGSPALHAAIDLAPLGEVLSGWSLSPDGRSLALATSTESGGSLYLSEADATPVPLAPVPGIGAITFSADGTSLFAASGARILQLDARSGAIIASLDASSFQPAAVPIPVPTEGRTPFAPLRNEQARIQDLAPSSDGARLYAIGGKTLCGYDLTGGPPSCQDLEITPSSFEPMPGGALLLSYSRNRTMPVWMLDAKTGHTWFVPAGSAQ